MVDARLRSEREREPIRIAPRHIVRVFVAAQCAEVLSVGRKNSQPAGAADVHVASLVHFDAVNSGSSLDDSHLEPADGSGRTLTSLNHTTSPGS